MAIQNTFDFFSFALSHLSRTSVKFYRMPVKLACIVFLLCQASARRSAKRIKKKRNLIIKNEFGCRPEAVGYPVRHLAFTDKGVGPGGESSLLAGIQLADEDNDGSGRADCPQLGQGVAGVYGD